MIGKFHATTSSWMMFLIVLIQIFALLATINVVYMSQSLICFAPQVSSALSILSYRRERIRIRKCLKLLRFYEIVLHRKPFCFTFGTFGRMSKRAFISFVLFYVVELFTIATHFIKQTDKIILH